MAVRFRRELRAFDGGGERVASAPGAVDDPGWAALELGRRVTVVAAIGAAVGPRIAAAARTMSEPGNEDTNKENHHEAA